MTQFEINVAEEGLNLFDIAINSHFYLTNSLTTRIIKKNYGSNFPGGDNELNGGTQLDTFSFEIKNIAHSMNQERMKNDENEEKFEQFREFQKREENPENITTADLVQLKKEIPRLEQFYYNDLKAQSMYKGNNDQAGF